jgi:hypothetical protein
MVNPAAFCSYRAERPASGNLSGPAGRISSISSACPLVWPTGSSRNEVNRAPPAWN